MRFMHRAIRTTVVLGALLLAGTAYGQGNYLLTGNSGGQLQIGTGLPLPVGTVGVFLGGMTVGTAGTFPPLFVPPNPAASTGGPGTLPIQQLHNTPQGGDMRIKPGVLSFTAVPNAIGTFQTNPAVMQVGTSISWNWPAPQDTFTRPMGTVSVVPGTVTLAVGGAPGPAVLGTATSGGIITYSGGAKAFGGSALFNLAAGPLQGTKRIPLNATGQPTLATVWINAFGALPGSVMTLAVVGASNPFGVAAAGATTAAPPGSTMFGALTTLGFDGVNVSTTMGFMCCTVNSMGSFSMGIPAGGAGLSNMVTGSKGFPFTTGLITVSQPAAAPPEVFFLSGTDTRATGALIGSGNVSLVAGALSNRALSGPNANRAWVSLNLVQTPEPFAMAGAAGALGMLALCHTVVRRRSGE